MISLIPSGHHPQYIMINQIPARLPAKIMTSLFPHFVCIFRVFFHLHTFQGKEKTPESL